MYEIVTGRSPKDLKEFETEGCGYIGKHIVGKGDEAHLTNKVLFDFLRPHVVLVAGKRGCLTGDTLVFTDKGYKKIKNFDERRDRVFSFNKQEKIFEVESAKLLHYPIENEELFRVEFENGKELFLTKEHPLLMTIGKKLLHLIWRQAKELKKGDTILSIGESLDDLRPLPIKEISTIQGIKDVYDLSVPKNHSFIANGIISHNSGKSYSGGVFAEEMALLPEELSQNLSAIMIDTMGIYWSMKYPNEDQLVLLDEWDLKPIGLKDKVQTYVPYKQKQEFLDSEVPVDFGISIAPHEFTAEDWTLAFNLPSTNPIGLGLQKVVNRLQDTGEKFTINEMISKVKDDRLLDTHVKSSLENMLTIADQWGVFGQEGIEIGKIAKPGTINVFDVSRLRATEAWSVRNLLVALICRKIYEHRVIARKQEELARMGEIKLDKRYPMVWLIIDEAHQFVPANEVTVSSRPLLNIVKQGRQPGISFVPMTQMPNKVHQEVISQTDLVISHRLTSKDDLNSLQAVMQNYLLEDLTKSIDSLPKWKGSAIILDDNSERLYQVQIRPRLTWHGGESAVAKMK